jgi:hypothetical protein
MPESDESQPFEHGAFAEFDAVSRRRFIQAASGAVAGLPAVLPQHTEAHPPMKEENSPESNNAGAESYPPDAIYLLDWWAGWVSWMHWGGGECGGFHGYDKWIKGWHEGITPHWLQELIFRALREYPWFSTNVTFNGRTLEQMQQWTPDVIAELAAWVRQGRIEICDSTYDSPYLFLFPGESQIRQLQYGRAAFRQVLGIEAKYLAMNEAAFHPQLAQILRLSGYTGVLLMTPWGHWGYSPSADEHRIWWEAPDGTSIDAIPANTASYRPPTSGRPFGLPHHDPQVRELFREAGSRWPLICPDADVGMNLTMYQFAEREIEDTYISNIAWYAPREVQLQKTMQEATRRQIERRDPAEALASPAQFQYLHDVLNYHFTTLGEYFRKTADPAVTKRFARDDFRYRHISGAFGDRPTISAHAAESRICDAESLCAMAQVAGGASRTQSLDETWKNLLQAQHFNNYCIPVEYCWRLGESPVGRAVRLAEEAERGAETICGDSLAFLAGRIDTRSHERPEATTACIISNTLGWSRSETVCVHVPITREGTSSLRCFDGDAEVPCQILHRFESNDGRLAEADLAFVAREVPGFGYKVYHLAPSNGPAKETAEYAESALALENDLLHLKFDDRGHLTSCVDKISGHEFLDTSKRLGNELTGRFSKTGFVSSRTSAASASLIERGPVRWTLSAKGKLGGYPYETLIRLAAGSRRIDFLTAMDFDVGARVGDLTNLGPGGVADPKSDGVGVHNQHDKLRTTFNPLLKGEGTLYSDLAFSAYASTRPYVLGISFGDLSDGASGLTLINTGNIGYYHAPENGAVLSLVLAYGGPHRGKGPSYLAGIHQFRYSLLPHSGDWKAAKSYRHASERAHPLKVHILAPHSGMLAAQHSLLQVEPANVMSTTLMPGAEPRVRIVEMEGRPTVATLRLNTPIERAEVIDLAGNVMRRCRVNGRDVEVALGAHEIATVSLPGLRW